MKLKKYLLLLILPLIFIITGCKASVVEKVSKDLKELFANLRENFDIREYIEINTCNRYEYFISF